MATPLPPLPYPSLPATLYLTEIARKFNFVLDAECDDSYPANAVTWSYDRGNGFKRTQWVHRSGVAFIQIDTTEEVAGFWWVANRMHLTGSGSAIGMERQSGKEQKGNADKGTDPDSLRKAFVEFCSNEQGLCDFWEEIRKKFMSAVASVGKSEEMPDGSETNEALTGLLDDLDAADVTGRPKIGRARSRSILDPNFFSPPVDPQ